MKMSAIRGRIARRVLVNVRIRPDVLAKILPPMFKPRLVDGWAIGGICFITLDELRMPFLPAAIGLKSNNTAHRFAVYSTDENGVEHDFVYVPRRDTDSKLSILVGKHCFPAELYEAKFDVEDHGTKIILNIASADSNADLKFAGTVTDNVATGSVFKSVEELSEFFRRGQVGYSPRTSTRELDGVRLETDTWGGSPLTIENFESSFFNDKNLFPEGSFEIDSAYLMRNINHYWYKENSLPANLCRAC
jgi:hypothetical protein